MKIKPISLGLPTQDGVELSITVQAHTTDALTTNLYYKVMSEQSETLADGTIYLTEQEFLDRDFENIVLTKLNLERL